MAISDLYTFRSGSVSVSATTATALLSVVAGTTVRLWVVKCAVEVGNTAAVAGNNLLFQLARPGNTSNGSGTTAGAAHDFSAPAAIGTGYTSWTLAPTVGTILAEWELPQSSGSMWEEYPPTNFEWQIPAIANNSANNGLHVFVTPSVNTATPILVNLTVSQ
jgi:hypothetical protein